MENKEAIEKLERQLKAICLGCMHRSVIGWCENHCRLPEAFNMAISALEKQEHNRWIPIAERLPKDGERVLITYDKNVIRATWDEMRGYFYNTSAIALDKDFVSAWMPLPEPYKEEDNE